MSLAKSFYSSTEIFFPLQVKHQLEMLKDEVFTETTSRHGSSNDGGGGGSESASIFAYSTATPERV